MLIGAHVSTAGGLPTRDRARRPSSAASRSRSSTRARACGGRPDTGRGGLRRLPRGDGGLADRSGVIHAVYLINCATKDSELRKKSLASLTHALRIGDGIGAAGVVLHPGAQKGEPHGPSMKRAAKVIAAALKDSESCPLLLEQTAGPQRPARPRLRRDRRADRAGGRRRAPRPLPRLLPPLRPGLRHHRRRAPGRGPRRSRREGRPRAAALPPRQRRRRPARLLPRPPRQRRQGRDGQAGPRRLPLRAPLRGPAGDPGDARPEEERPGPQGSPAAKRLRKAGLEATRSVGTTGPPRGESTFTTPTVGLRNQCAAPRAEQSRGP